MPPKGHHFIPRLHLQHFMGEEPAAGGHGFVAGNRGRRRCAGGRHRNGVATRTATISTRKDFPDSAKEKRIWRLCHITSKLRPACHSDLRYMSQGLARDSIPRLERQTVKNGRVVRSQRADRRRFWKVSITLTFPQTSQDRSAYLSPHGQQVVLHGPVLRSTIRCPQND